jgi:GTPase SAR1 family protein
MIIAFDLTNRKSFENVRAWIDSIYRHSTDTSLPKVLVGNKVDLADSNDQKLRATARSEALKIAAEHEIQYFETSAKENINVNEVMQHIMSKVYENLYKKNKEEEEGKPSIKPSVILGDGGSSQPGAASGGSGGWTQECQC